MVSVRVIGSSLRILSKVNLLRVSRDVGADMGASNRQEAGPSINLTRRVTKSCNVVTPSHLEVYHCNMGIKGLTALLSEHAPNAIKEHDIKTLFGRKVAIDASMSIYQFLIAVRQKDGEMLTNDAGETTSHLMGLFYRTIRIVENGIKPAYVFDGKPPEMKKGVVSG